MKTSKRILGVILALALVFGGALTAVADYGYIGHNDPNGSVASFAYGDEFTMTFDLNGGNINGDTDNVISNIAEDEPITDVDVPTNPSRLDYTFDGWSA